MEKPGSAIMTAQLGIQLTIVVVAARNSCGLRVATVCCTASPLSKKISTTRTYACVEVTVPVVVVLVGVRAANPATGAAADPVRVAPDATLGGDGY